MQGKSKKKSASSKSFEERLSRARELVIKVLPYKEKKEYINALKDETKFKKATDFLDPSKREKVKVLAKLIPKMKKALKTASQPEMLEIVKLMQDDTIRVKVFELINDKEVREQVLIEKEKIKQGLVKKALEAKRKNVIFRIIKNNKKYSAIIKKWPKNRTKEFIKHIGHILRQ